MDEPVKKKVDESWKEQAEREKRASPHLPSGPPLADRSTPSAPQAAAEGGGGQVGGPAGGGEELPEARFDLFVSGLAMEALIALGDMPHPATRKQAMNLPHAKYLIDLLGLFDEKTKGNLSVDEERLLTDTLYQLRMRYLGKSGTS